MGLSTIAAAVLLTVWQFVTLPMGLNIVGRDCLRITEKELGRKSFVVVSYNFSKSGKGGSVYDERFWIVFDDDRWKSLWSPTKVECSKSTYDEDWAFDTFKIEGRALEFAKIRKHLLDLSN